VILVVLTTCNMFVMPSSFSSFVESLAERCGSH